LVAKTEAAGVGRPILVEELAPEEEETIMFEVEPPLIRTAVVEMNIGTTKPEAPVAKKKKKGKRDEIDDIFG
jgi:hypothetical protein